MLDDGRVVEHGPRAALAADPASRYARLRTTARAADTTDADAGSTASSDDDLGDDLVDRPEEVSA